MRVMISCGEPSGDLYAGALAAEIRKIDSSAAISGFGSDRLRAAGAELIGDFHGLSVTGLLEVAGLLPRAYGMYRRLVNHARNARPDVFVAVDFPDFNFLLARAMKKAGIPVVYYVSPQLWAWRRGRIKTMKRIADRVLVIFPFEESIYREAQVPVEWVGHPLLELTSVLEPRAEFLRRHGLDPDAPVIALLPGSRRNEVGQILPGLAEAAALIRYRVPRAQFIAARAPHVAPELFGPLKALEAQGAPVVVVEGEADAVLASADLALVASGTITVQAALHDCPMVVVYRLSPVTYRLGKPFVHVDTYAMVNLVAGRTIVPELIQDAFTPRAVAEEALRVLSDPAHAKYVRAELREVRAKLGHPGASRRAAKAVLAAARKK
jgi:lipid-A-disaccharide synthase